MNAPKIYNKKSTSCKEGTVHIRLSSHLGFVSTISNQKSTLFMTLVFYFFFEVKFNFLPIGKVLNHPHAAGRSSIPIQKRFTAKYPITHSLLIIIWKVENGLVPFRAPVL